MSDGPFLWQFPSYMLAANYSVDSGGGIIFDEKIRFPTPKGPDGRPCIAVFTDQHAAEDYREKAGLVAVLNLLEIPTAAALKSFLRRARASFYYVAIDPNPTAPLTRGIAIDTVLSDLETPGSGNQTGG